MIVNYDDYSTEVLVECLPENRPLYKDSGLWTIFEDDLESPIIEQTCNESFRQFLIRYYEFISEHEDMEYTHISLACGVR